jgi:hypothetical protein
MEAKERRRSLEESILLQKLEFMQRHDSELQLRQAKEREKQRAYRLAHENDTQRQMRIAAEEEVKTQRAKEFQALENKRKRELEDVTVFFEQSSNRFLQKYGNATKRVSDGFTTKELRIRIEILEKRRKKPQHQIGKPHLLSVLRKRRLQD